MSQPALARSHPPIVLVGSDALAARLVDELAKLEDVDTGSVARRPVPRARRRPGAKARSDA